VRERKNEGKKGGGGVRVEKWVQVCPRLSARLPKKMKKIGIICVRKREKGRKKVGEGIRVWV